MGTDILQERSGHKVVQEPFQTGIGHWHLPYPDLGWLQLAFLYLVLSSKCHNLAKQLKSLFTFLFFSGLTIQGWSAKKYHITKYHRVTGLWVTVRWCHTTKSHGNCGKIVHRPWSSCISSIGNLMGTPLSSPCQLRLVLWEPQVGKKTSHTFWTLSLKSPSIQWSKDRSRIGT